MKNVIRLLTFFAIVATLALPAFAQNAQPAATPAACAEEAKANELYETWRKERTGDQKIAYEAGKQMGQLCPNNELYVKYVKKFVDRYEAANRRFEFAKAYGGKDYTVAYQLGREIVTAEPDNLTTLIALGWGGYLATTEKNEAFNADAANYARRALQSIKSGKEPMVFDAKQNKDVVNWAPFNGRDDAVARLNYALGVYSIKQPEESLPYFITVAQTQNNPLSKEPQVYSNIAFAYQAGQYNKLAEDYKVKCQAGGVVSDTPECKAQLDTLNNVVDRIVDAYARAIAYSGTDPKYQSQKTEYMNNLTQFYKFRNNNSDTGLTELIAGVLSKPLPTGAVAPTPVMAPATTPTPTTTGDAMGTGNGATGTSMTTTTTTTTTPATSPAPKPATTEMSKPKPTAPTNKP